jgi:hypothetical protein
VIYGGMGPGARLSGVLFHFVDGRSWLMTMPTILLRIVGGYSTGVAFVRSRTLVCP